MRLDGAEMLTTTTAAVVSTALYARLGEPYLARGVLGDLAGFAVLAGVLTSRHRRARHEALVCLGLIGTVLVVHPDWPLRYRPSVWWAAVIAGLGAYLALRTWVLQGRSRG